MLPRIDWSLRTRSKCCFELGKRHSVSLELCRLPPFMVFHTTERRNHPCDVQHPCTVLFGFCSLLGRYLPVGQAEPYARHSIQAYQCLQMSVAYYAIIEGLIQRRIHPSLFWWSSIFPVGTVVTAMSSLGKDLDSPAFRVLAIILFTFLFLIYLVNASFTIPMTLSGELLGLPKRNDFCIKGLPHSHSWSGRPRHDHIT